jgi:hypothetical protein
MRFAPTVPIAAILRAGFTPIRRPPGIHEMESYHGMLACVIAGAGWR